MAKGMGAVLGAMICLGAAPAWAQAGADRLPSELDRGSGQQAWQNPGYAALAAKCKAPPASFRIPISTNTGEPPRPAMPAPSAAIPGVIAADQSWSVVFAWEGNNVDGPIADGEGAMLAANNDAGNVIRIDTATGRARVLYPANTGGALSRSKTGALFVAERGLGQAVTQLEPARKVLANSFNGEPLECVGGVINDIAADARGGVYVAVSGGGLLYADPAGKVSKWGQGMEGANGIVLSGDERTLYVGNGRAVVAFDVGPGGALSNQRDLASLRTGRNADGMAIDTEGRIHVSTGEAVDVFARDGAFLGSIAGPAGLHGVAFGGKDKKTLYGIVFYGGWGSPAARTLLIAIPTEAQGYLGRAK